MLSRTLSEYEKTYKSRLLSFLKDWEDNTESLFFKNDLNDYTNYYNSLKKVTHFTKTSPSNNLGHYPVTSEVGWVLEIINKPVFNEIISEKKADPEYDEDEFNRLLYPGKNAPSIEINIKVLNNRITSAKRILDFINDKKANLQTPVAPENETETMSCSIAEDHLPQKPKKIPAKWHALQYLLELKAKGLKPPISTEGTFIKSELEKIGKIRTGLSGQGFYRSVLKHYTDLDKPEMLNNSFGKGWKDTVLKLSNGDNTLKEYIDNHY